MSPDEVSVLLGEIKGECSVVQSVYRTTKDRLLRAVRILAGREATDTTASLSGTRLISKGQAMEVLAEQATSQELLELYIQRTQPGQVDCRLPLLRTAALKLILDRFTCATKGEWAIPYKVLKDCRYIADIPEFVKLIKSRFAHSSEPNWELQMKNSIRKYLSTKLPKQACMMITDSFIAALDKAGQHELCHNANTCRKLYQLLKDCRMAL